MVRRESLSRLAIAFAFRSVDPFNQSVDRTLETVLSPKSEARGHGTKVLFRADYVPMDFHRVQSRLSMNLLLV